MAVSKQTLAGGAVVLGSGGAVTGIAIANRSGETIAEKLKDKLLPFSGLDQEWKALATKLKDSSSITKDSLKTVKENEGTTPTGEKLKAWCEEQSKQSSSNEELTNLVETWCVYKISEKLGTTHSLSVTEGTTDEANWKIKAQLLSEYEKPKTGEALELKYGIETAKQEIKNLETDWKKLREKCKEIYNNWYQGENTDLWKLTKAFCSKPTIKEALLGTELPTDNGFDTEWNNKLTEAKKSDTSGAKDTQLKTDVADTTNGKSNLQKWCGNQYTKLNGEKVSGSTEHDLLTEVKRLCALTIKEKLDSNSEENKRSISDTNDDTSLTNNIKALNKYTKTTNDPELTPELKDLQNTTDKENTEKKNDLKEWCKSIWNKGYKNDDLYKLADKFCRKGTTV